MSTSVLQPVLGYAARTLAALFVTDEASHKRRDKWAGRTFTVLSRVGDRFNVRDEAGSSEIIDLSYGAVQAIEDALVARNLRDVAGLMLKREMYDLEGLTFWRWNVCG